MQAQSGTTLIANSQNDGLIFDTEGITLISRYPDELAAHRSKRRWIDVLNCHFLLEKERDFEIGVTPLPEEGCYALTCTFTSACGRYSFWRLINHQAPDAEKKMLAKQEHQKKQLKNNPHQGATGTDHSSWFSSIINKASLQSSENITLLKRLMRFFS